MKYLVADIGELGWSIYAKAHVRWLESQGHDVLVATTKDRASLYDNVTIVDMGEFKQYPQDGFGRYGVSHETLKANFKNCLNFGRELSPFFFFGCKRISKENLIFEPFHKDVIVFPRFRESEHHAFRNLSIDFYGKLIRSLLEAGFTVKTMGISSGSYSIDILNNKYTNMINQTTDVLDMIRHIKSASCVIGGTSAPPKLAMLESIPTFVIGHEKHRFTVEENYMNSEVGFYELEDYTNFNEDECVKEVVAWTYRVAL